MSGPTLNSSSTTHGTPTPSTPMTTTTAPFSCQAGSFNGTGLMMLIPSGHLMLLQRSISGSQEQAKQISALVAAPQNAKDLTNSAWLPTASATGYDYGASYSVEDDLVSQAWSGWFGW